MYSSKEVLERTGISRATLNNYISSGIVPRPDVLAPESADTTARRIGYFPVEVVQRIEEIQRLKREGWSLDRITEHFGGGGTGQAAKPPERDLAGGVDVAGLTAMGGTGAMPPAAAAPGRGAVAGAGSPPPGLTQLAVLFARLQQPSRLWAELPPEEYFELVNDIWLELDPIFERHRGSGVRHPGEGLVCFFLVQPDSSYLCNALAAAWEVRAAMRRVSRHWQSRKGWNTELFMNTGVAQGRDWLGYLRPGSEMTVMGDAGDHAAALSAIARDGSIWATRDLVAKLAPEERAQLKYGVQRRDASGGETLVSAVFSRVENLTGVDASVKERLRAVARLPITDVLDFGPPSVIRK